MILHCRLEDFSSNPPVFLIIAGNQTPIRFILLRINLHELKCSDGFLSSIRFGSQTGTPDSDLVTDETESQPLESHDEWLKLQQEWAFSKHRLIEENEFLAEEMERKKWRAWAEHASEVERQRRIQLLRSIDEVQEWERQARRKWAIEAIERERNERISDNFLSNLSATQWFNETISAYHEDYELVGS